jgi:hypothetical protein
MKQIITKSLKKYNLTQTQKAREQEPADDDAAAWQAGGRGKKFRPAVYIYFI